jgi:hypothetical protein
VLFSVEREPDSTAWLISVVVIDCAFCSCISS